MLPLVEDFHTLQGEGAWTGTAAWFIRLGGCDVGCSWCDAKETWNPRVPMISVDEIIGRITNYELRITTVVVTGGEPLMWNLDELTERLRERGMKTHLETSGSHPFSGSWDWVCLSPKRKQPPLDEAWARADELKVIIETEEDLDAITNYEFSTSRATSSTARMSEARMKISEAELRPGRAAKRITNGTCLYLQPEWSRRDEMMPLIVDYIKRNPRWRMSLQAHKYMRIP